MNYKANKVVKTKRGTYRMKRTLEPGDIVSLALVIFILGFVAIRSLIG